MRIARLPNDTGSASFNSVRFRGEQIRHSVSVSLFCLLLSAPPISAQAVSGEITGSVTDPGGAAIASAVVSLVSDLDKQTREFVTNSSGEFLFTGVVTVCWFSVN